MKAAASELGELRGVLQGERWSHEVLCAKIMKRKALYCCTADPHKPVRGGERGERGGQRSREVAVVVTGQGVGRGPAGEMAGGELCRVAALDAGRGGGGGTGA